MSLSTLHQVFQTAMGWTNLHLHRFEVNGISYQVPDPDFPFGADERNVRGVRLDQLLQEVNSRGSYVYDFGDDWVHELVVESIGPNTLPVRLPVCIGGARACPPEDCGGPRGYVELIKALANQRHPEQGNMLTWVGWSFDPRGFDLNQVNKRLTRFQPRQ